jgi:Glycosyltransferase family 87
MSETIASTLPLAKAGWLRRFGQGLAWKLVFVGLPAVVFLSPLVAAITLDADWAFDFKQFWQGAHDVVHGRSPYPSAELLATASDRLDPTGIQHVFRFPYPAWSAVVLAPFGLLPFTVAAALFTVVLAAAIPLGLRLLGVRDVRVLLLSFGLATVSGAIRIGTLTPLLFLAVGALWRYRDRRWVTALIGAAAIPAKLFLWPLLIWLASTRRMSSAVLAVALGLGVTLLSWAAIGFDGFAGYPELVGRLTDTVESRGYSLVALGIELGLPLDVSRALPLAVGLPVLAGVAWCGRAGHDDASFSLALLASILLTPVVWLHYFTLLLAPLALNRTRLSWPWALPLFFWIVQSQENLGDLWRIVTCLLVAGGIIVTSMVPGRQTEAARAT